MADDKIGTHYDGCEQYHLECAKHALADRDRRVEALTKALRELVEAWECRQAHADSTDEAFNAGPFIRWRAALKTARKALASAAGAEGEA